MTRPGVVDATGLEELDRFPRPGRRGGPVRPPHRPRPLGGLPRLGARRSLRRPGLARSQVAFWSDPGCLRYRGRSTIVAYDLLNEPCVGWDTPAMRPRWAQWLQADLQDARGTCRRLGPVPIAHCRSSRFAHPSPRCPVRQASWTTSGSARTWPTTGPAAKPRPSSTPTPMPWSRWVPSSGRCPALLPTLRVYSGFRPERQARLLDFLELHFYPLEDGFYEYTGPESESRNLAYLESVVREVARPGKPVVVAEFGWYGGITPTFDGGRHPRPARPTRNAGAAAWSRSPALTPAAGSTGAFTTTPKRATQAKGPACSPRTDA